MRDARLVSGAWCWCRELRNEKKPIVGRTVNINSDKNAKYPPLQLDVYGISKTFCLKDSTQDLSNYCTGNCLRVQYTSFMDIGDSDFSGTVATICDCAKVHIRHKEYI